MKTPDSALVEQAKRELQVAWNDYQQVKPVCIQFGHVCYDWQQKLKTTELTQVWAELGIKEVEALREMDSYLDSIGVKRIGIEKRTNREQPDNFEDIRKIAISIFRAGYAEMRKTDVSSTLLDSARTWALGKLKEKEPAIAA